MPPSTPDPTLWLTDLMAKQQELLKSLAPPGTPAAADPANPLAPWMQAANAFTQWQQQALQQMTMMRTAAVPAGAATPAVDRRFAADPWCQDPRFDGIARAYLSQSELLRQTLDTAPLDERSKAQWGFVLRQVVDALSPANCLATNPEALQAALDSGGASLVEGTRLFMEDFAKGRVSMTDESAFEVGRNVATSRGSCGVRERAVPAHPVHAAARRMVHERPLLVVPPCINKFYILDLQPENSFVALCGGAGPHAYSWCRWRNAGPEQGGHGLGRLPRAGRHAGDRRGARDQRRRAASTRWASASAARCSPARSRCWRRAATSKVASLTLLTTMLDFSDTGEIGLLVDEQSAAARESDDRTERAAQGQELARRSASCAPNDLVWNYVVSATT